VVVALDGRVLPLGWADQLGRLEDDLLTSLRKAKRGQPSTVSRSHDEYNRDSRPLHKNTMPIWLGSSTVTSSDYCTFTTWNPE